MSREHDKAWWDARQIVMLQAGDFHHGPIRDLYFALARSRTQQYARGHARAALVELQALGIEAGELFGAVCKLAE